MKKQYHKDFVKNFKKQNAYFTFVALHQWDKLTLETKGGYYYLDVISKYNNYWILCGSHTERYKVILNINILFFVITQNNTCTCFFSNFIFVFISYINDCIQNSPYCNKTQHFLFA